MYSGEIQTLIHTELHTNQTNIFHELLFYIGVITFCGYIVLRSFDAHRINPESRQAVEKLLVERKESFDPKNARRASVAAAPLASWVTANVKYSYVLEKIRPLEREQSKLYQNMKLAEQQIGKLSSGLTDVDKTVSELKNQLNTYTKEAAEIEIHLNKAQETINAAEGLVGKLNDEFERWKKQVQYFKLHSLL